MLHYSHLSGDSNGDAEGFSGISISLFTLLQLPVASPDASFNQSGAQEFPGAQEFRATVEDDGLDADYSMVGDYPEEPDYYVLLGLSRNPPPTEAEIRSAYRNLTPSFHPPAPREGAPLGPPSSGPPAPRMKMPSRQAATASPLRGRESVQTHPGGV
ncbi:hypothetical protein N7505_007461 [Penicillium chrysogenum]|uniref:J domain-containing protein n=1 Tax=Penicillium chrysogenum TaxID=5076 RepID=A0ABQ8WE73_PENCH|nr:hypothetical protein N7505_007461 [Penicillium chrysogenum]